jgi:hypothetical protein
VADAEGRVVDVGFLQLAADPRHEIQPDVLRGIAIYNKLALLDGSEMPTINLSSCDAPDDTFEEVKLAGPIG